MSLPALRLPKEILEQNRKKNTIDGVQNFTKTLTPREKYGICNTNQSIHFDIGKPLRQPKEVLKQESNLKNLNGCTTTERNKIISSDKYLNKPIGAALSKPKKLQKYQENLKKDVKNVLVTMKTGENLVLTSDAYHGILSGKDIYKCVFCDTTMKLDSESTGVHVVSSKHKLALEKFPHLELYGNNLIRKIDEKEFYCTLCNVIVYSVFVNSHVQAEFHKNALNRAILRSTIYKPM